MRGSPTTAIEIDTTLLEELRAAFPGTPDRELLEDMARLQLGHATLRRVQERFNLSEDDATAVGVEAVREARACSDA